MCTVTFLPQKKGYILTSNRDESALRSPQNLSSITKNGHQLVFPRDKGAGGTWIALAATNRLVCLLNGAYERHERRLPYRMSRGQMVLDFFDYQNADLFFTQYNFYNIEPFTLIIIDKGKLYDFRWDGQEKHILALDPQEKHIWSSATLYEKEVQEKRKKWFAEWIFGRTDFGSAAILDLHKKGGEGNPSIDFMMNRYNYLVQTVSITQIIKTEQAVEMFYHDLITNKKRIKSLKIKKNKT